MNGNFVTLPKLLQSVLKTALWALISLSHYIEQGCETDLFDKYILHHIIKEHFLNIYLGMKLKKRINIDNN